MKKILITGGLGYIGSKITEKLIEKNYDVIILDNYYTNVRKKIKNSKIIKCDITKFSELYKLKIKNISAVIHLAAQSSGPKSYEIPEIDININILGTINMIKFCKKNKIKKFLFSSSFTVYGQSKKFKLNENDSCNPKSFYAVSKFASEKYIQLLCNKYKIQWNILRLFNVYGPGQDLKRADQGIVSIYLNYIKNSNILPLKGSLKRFRDLIYIDDVVAGWLLCLESKTAYNQIFNLGTGKKTYISKIIALICDLYRKKIKIKKEEGTPGDILGCYADTKKIKKFLKFETKYDFKKGLKLFKEWANKEH